MASGFYGLACWNALSPAQQTRLIKWGNLPIGSQPEGTPPDGCVERAFVGVETETDEAPGPRFYCLPCGAAYLTALASRRADAYTDRTRTTEGGTTRG